MADSKYHQRRRYWEWGCYTPKKQFFKNQEKLWEHSGELRYDKVGLK